MVIYNKANLGMTLKFKKEELKMNLDFTALKEAFIAFLDRIADLFKNIIAGSIEL